MKNYLQVTASGILLKWDVNNTNKEVVLNSYSVFFLFSVMHTDTQGPMSTLSAQIDKLKCFNMEFNLKPN